VKRIAYVLALPAASLVLAAAVSACTVSGDGNAAARNAASEPDAALVQRLAIAYGALRDVEGARRIDAAHRYARVAVDAIAGPRGRHGAHYAYPGGILPEDGDAIVEEPGLALRAYDVAPPGSPLRSAVENAVTGDVVAWRAPGERYDAIDQAVRDYRPERDTIAALNGNAERALAWALLTLETENVVEARARARHGAQYVKRALDAVRSARAAQAAGRRQ
jgi:hypothetical protein